MSAWEAVIGLEIHAQLATASKIFSSSPTAYGAAPNAQADAVDLGLPGVLPVLNAEAVRFAALFGLAIGAEVARRSVFARKNYFYPDLPKGYQISQYELPIVAGGAVTIEVEGRKRVPVTRAHLEEDAGKSVHDVPGTGGMTGVDLNRAGTPLLEIVSEPALSSAAEAAAYMRRIHELVRYLGICDGNMQEGSFRADANVSVRRPGAPLGTRAEIKNLNSFRFIEQAIDYEIERQIALLENGGEIVQETRLYDPERDETRAMRGKEEANDYRYFPDPDLLPVELDDAYLDALRAGLPELPDARRARYIAAGLRREDAEQLTASRALGDYFDSAAAGGRARMAANWITGELAAALNRDGLDIVQSRVSALQLAALLERIDDGALSSRTAKTVFERLWSDPAAAEDGPAAALERVDAIIEREGLRQVSDSAAIEAEIAAVLAANPDQLAQFRAGKTKVKGFFVGQIMKKFRGKANPQQLNALLDKRLAGDDD